VPPLYRPGRRGPYVEVRVHLIRRETWTVPGLPGTKLIHAAGQFCRVKYHCGVGENFRGCCRGAPYLSNVIRRTSVYGPATNR
jgi:hypothetical protein